MCIYQVYTIYKVEQHTTCKTINNLLSCRYIKQLKAMLELFNSGGPLFMSILTIILIILVYCSFKHKQKLNLIGRLGLIVGVLGHLLGLYSMFEALESLESGVSPTLIASGIKVSMICLIYGLLIYIISLLILLFKK